MGQLRSDIMKNIKARWVYGKEISSDEVRAVEKELNVSYPREFFEIVKMHDGGEIEFELQEEETIEGVVDIEGWGEESFRLLKHGKVHVEIMSNFKRTRDALPNLFIPFADDGGGNYFVFDFSEDRSNPKIYFQFHEEVVLIEDLVEDDLKDKTLEELQKEELYFVANSFNEFLEKVRPVED